MEEKSMIPSLLAPAAFLSPLTLQVSFLPFFFTFCLPSAVMTLIARDMYLTLSNAFYEAYVVGRGVWSVFVSYFLLVYSNFSSMNERTLKTAVCFRG